MLLRPSVWMRCCTTWLKSAAFSQCCSGLSCRGRLGGFMNNLAWTMRPTDLQMRDGENLRPGILSARLRHFFPGRSFRYFALTLAQFLEFDFDDQVRSDLF